MLDRVRVVLVGTSHPGNIGAAARACRTMGLQRLELVCPRTPPKSSEALARAAGAADVLRAAPVRGSLLEAVGGCRMVTGTSARPREMSLPILTPADWARRACEELAADRGAEAAIVFGREDRGLDNKEMGLCQFQSIVDADPAYGSLNLAMAVQVYCYEARTAWLERGGGDGAAPAESGQAPAATAAQIDALVRHAEQALLLMDFYGKAGPRQVPARIRRMVQRMRPDAMEVGILRGALARLERVLESARADRKNQGPEPADADPGTDRKNQEPEPANTAPGTDRKG